MVYKSALFICFFIFFQFQISSSQTLTGISPLKGSQYDYVYATTIDSKGNKYVSAMISTWDRKYNIQDSIYSYNGQYGGINVVVKYNAKDEVVWVKDFGFIKSMAIDANDNVYISGSYQQYTFIFIKVNGNGDILWKYTQGTSGGMSGEDIIVDNDGNAYVTGDVLSWDVFGIPIHSQSCCLDHDFLAKFSPKGTLLWARASGIDSWTWGKSLAFDKDGNIILGGTYVFTMRMDNYSLPANTFGYTNTYIASFTPNGSVNWLKGFGGSTGHLSISDLVIDTEGFIYFSGAYRGTVNLGDTILHGGDNYDLFVTKFSKEMNRKWVITASTALGDAADNLLVTSDGILMSGTVGGNAKLGDITLSGITQSKAVLSRINKNGKVIWFKDFGTIPSEPYYSVNFEMGYFINAINDHCFFVAGNYVGELSSSTRTLIASSLETDCFVGVISEIPATNDLGPDVYLEFCESSEVKISLKPSAGQNYWSKISGNLPIINDSDPTSIIISNISYGKTVFGLSKDVCISESRELFTIDRIQNPLPPAIHNPYVFCSNKLSTSQISLQGDSLHWYGDPQLKTLLNVGHAFLPTGSATLYITDKINGCEGLPSQLKIIVNEQPVPPTAETSSYCLDEPVNLTAHGTDLKWYDQINSLTPVYEGSFFTTTNSNSSLEIFVTQTVDDCESEKASVTESGFSFQIDDIVLTNVITPNGDGFNDFFYLPSFDAEVCAKAFKNVRVINRWGEEVYYSEDRNFKWDAANESASVYYYRIEFEAMSFNNSLNIRH